MSGALPLVGVISDAGPGTLDAELVALSGILRARGLRVAGAVQHNTERPNRRCDMVLEILPSRARFQISEDRGPLAQGCRLDPDGLTAAVHALDRAMDDPFDVFVLNKFGARELEGAGFRDALARALIAGVPAVVGLGASKRPAFEAFLGAPLDCAQARADALADWVCARVAPHEEVVI